MNRKNYSGGFKEQAAFGKTGTQGPHTPTHPNYGHFSCVLKYVCFMVTGGEGRRDHISGTDTKKE